jgi:hypothetical protein
MYCSSNSRSGQSLATLFSVNMHDFDCCVCISWKFKQGKLCDISSSFVNNYHRVLSFVFNFHGYEKSENLYWNGELDYQTWDCKKWERPAQLKGRPAFFFLVETLFFKYKKLSWSEVSSEKHWKLCLNILYIIERRKEQLIWKKL